LGLSAPATFGEFQQALAAAKRAGDVPIQFGNNEAYPGIHEFAVIQDRMAAEEDLTNFILGRRGNQLSFDTPQNIQAAATLQDWAKKGYFTPGFGGRGYDSAIAHCPTGPAPLMT